MCSSSRTTEIQAESLVEGKGKQFLLLLHLTLQDVGVDKEGAKK